MDEEEKKELMGILEKNIREVRKELHSLLTKMWLIEQTLKSLVEDAETRGEKGP